MLAEEASQGAEIEACKERLVRALAAVDAHLEALRRCEKRCTEDYKRAVLMADRNVAYEELSAMLGEGFEATNALNVAAWKSAGVPGYRPLVVAALNAVRDLSMAYRALDTTLRSLRELRKAEALIAKTNAYKAQVREKERRRAQQAKDRRVHFHASGLTTRAPYALLLLLAAAAEPADTLRPGSAPAFSVRVLSATASAPSGDAQSEASGSGAKQRSALPSRPSAHTTTAPLPACAAGA